MRKAFDSGLFMQNLCVSFIVILCVFYLPILQGHPYMESLTENKALMYSIVGSAGAILALAMGVFPDMAYQFEIVDFTAEVSCTFHTICSSILCSQSVSEGLIPKTNIIQIINYVSPIS
jgi:hypothetical protein